MWPFILGLAYVCQLLLLLLLLLLLFCFCFMYQLKKLWEVFINIFLEHCLRFNQKIIIYSNTGNNSTLEYLKLLNFNKIIWYYLSKFGENWLTIKQKVHLSDFVREISKSKICLKKSIVSHFSNFQPLNLS